MIAEKKYAEEHTQGSGTMEAYHCKTSTNLILKLEYFGTLVIVG